MTSPSQDRLFGTNSSMAIKVPCRVATTASITRSGEQTIDGVAVVSGDRVLVKDQSSGVENGIYIADTSEWQRAPDFDGTRDVTAGTLVYVTAGSAGQGFWYVTTAGTIVVGTTSIAFQKASSVLAVVSAFMQSVLQSVGPAIEVNTGGATNDPGMVTNGEGLYVVGAAGKSGVVHLVNYTGADSSVLFQASGGTDASPSQVLNGQILGTINARGRDSTGWTTTSNLRFTYYATEDWTASARGAKMVWEVTPNGSATIARKMQLTGDGTLSVGNALASVAVGGVNVSLNTAEDSTASSTAAFAAISADGAGVQYVARSYGGVPSLVFDRFNGTLASPSAVASGDDISIQSYRGYGTSLGNAVARIRIQANENFTGSAKGTRLVFEATPNGSPTPAEQARFANAIYFPAAGTTASAANAFLDSGSSPANQLLRSTSSVRYKREIEDLDYKNAAAILNARPVWYRSKIERDRQDWSHYGLIAEEVAKIDPRLVQWGYRDEDKETVIVEKEDGEKVSETHIKEGAKLVPDGVAYERLAVLLIPVVKRLTEEVTELKAKIEALGKTENP